MWKTKDTRRYFTMEKGEKKMNIKAKLEALLFVAGEKGIALNQLCELLKIEKKDCQTELNDLQKDYQMNADRGIILLQVSHMYKLVTKSEAASLLKHYVKDPKNNRLSQAALETLSIVAYRQPISRIQIDLLRGVQSAAALQTLVFKQLVEEKGRDDKPGKAILLTTVA